MRIKSLLWAAVFVMPMLACFGSALAEVRQGAEVSISKDEVIDDDLYIIAQKITVDGTINGDLIVAGQKISINGSVDGDLIAASQEIVVKGKVSDDARIASQIIKLLDGGVIGDDLIATGYSLECTKASRIGGEARYAGYQSLFAGTVEKDVSIVSANSMLSGSFGKSVKATIDRSDYALAGFWGVGFPPVPPGLTVTETAEIDGDLIYQSPQEANIDSQSTISGEVEHSRIETEDEKPPTITDRIISSTKQFFAMMLVGLLVVYLCPDWTSQVVNNIGRRPLASFGWGVLTLIAVIFTAVLLLVSMIAIAVLLGYVSLDNLIPACLWMGSLTIAVLIVGFWLFSSWIAKVIVSAWAGNRIINGPDWISHRRALSLAVGVLIFAVLTLIPTVGGIVGLLVMLMGVGSASLWLFTSSEPPVPGKS